MGSIFIEINNKANFYFKKVIKPSKEETQKHKEYLNKYLKKNFFN